MFFKNYGSMPWPLKKSVMFSEGRKMARPTRPPHDGVIANAKTFGEALRNLSASGPIDLNTDAGTPFTAEAHVAQGGNHAGQDCIRITRDGAPRAYIYECCWGHLTSCSGTYIDVYSTVV
tara:strand:+ start:994 stop:1353 length:360 start_codon:yes stop_codon:yes gene_type:complete